MNAKVRIILAVTACIACLALLTGCMAPNAETDQDKNRKYMAAVNETMATMEDGLAEFDEAVKSGEVVTLSNDLSVVDEAVADLKAMEVPEAMKGAHESYVKGAEEMQTALKLYVQLYEDVKAPAEGDFDYGTYSDRLKEVQDHYDTAVSELEKADKLVSEA
jgi:hypothetical protein